MRTSTPPPPVPLSSHKSNQNNHQLEYIGIPQYLPPSTPPPSKLNYPPYPLPSTYTSCYRLLILMIRDPLLVYYSILHWYLIWCALWGSGLVGLVWFHAQPLVWRRCGRLG